MKKFFGIAVFSILSLTLNLNAMRNCPIDLIFHVVDCVSPEELKVEFSGLFPDERSQRVLKDYCETIKAISESTNEAEIDMRMREVVRQTTNQLLSYGVNIPALKTLSQDPRWNPLFDEILKEISQRRFAICKQMASWALPPIVGIVLLIVGIYVMNSIFNNVVDPVVNQALQEGRCLVHHFATDCPCVSLHTQTELELADEASRLKCVFHVLKEIILRNGCPCFHGTPFNP